ncbi:MAG: RibD family protein [Armatimonadetes bacterium]|nr:RibD family protein [Armatimonadota bacterium]
MKPEIYNQLEFPAAPPDRPYVLMNMVATIDGKTVSGTNEEDVVDLGSKFDHLILRHLTSCCDAVLIGAQTLRGVAPTWDPPVKKRVVVTRSGKLRGGIGFTSRGLIVAAPAGTQVSGVSEFELLESGRPRLDWALLMQRLRQDYAVERLMVLGGSEVNAEVIRKDLVDELFLTIAPKVKLGRDVNTYAGGEPLPRNEMKCYDLLEVHRVDQEVFLRYRRGS